ncbi:MAG: penicillin-binding protein [Candidatus Rokubacteria bacterium]|nr:penicillin-binding protein [Candidatus Rokubacteria bacterium]
MALRSRTLILAALLACAFLGLIARLVVLQVVKHESLTRLAERQHSKTIALKPKRGSIVDRHGRPLAVSSAAESLYALPARIPDPERLAASLAPVLNESAADIHKRLVSDRPFTWVRRKLPPPVAQSVRALGQPGLGFVEDSLRFYPNRELASHLLGFAGADGRGLEGIEHALDGHLAGHPGVGLVERDGLGRELGRMPAVLRPPTPGREVRLTLDTTIQYLVEREIETAWRRTRSKAALALVLDPRTGEVLALAMRPTFNPNNFAAASSAEWRNRAITDPFEPGSTFKVILAAAALEEGVARPTDRVYAEEGAITVASSVIHDWKRYGWLTFSEVLQHSSNVGAIKIGLGLGKERFHRYMAGFGFGSLTGLGLPGESRGKVRPPEIWSGLSLASMSIGQEVSVTAIQLATAFGAIANGGRLLRPQVVRAVIDPDGREVQELEPRVVRQVISPVTARTLSEILTRVVAEGTGRQAVMADYDVAGKTGTAQKLDPTTRRYSHAPGVLSFVGFAPAEDPRFVMLVLLDEPQAAKWGSEAAAPVFAAVGGRLLRYLNVPPRDTPPLHIVRGPSPGPTVPGSGAQAARVPDGVPDQPRMPQLVGQRLRPALAALALYGVEVELRGHGVVVAQEPAAGAELGPATLCRLELAEPTGT